MFNHQVLVITLLVHSAATFKQVSQGDCRSFPTEYMRKRHEVTDDLSRVLAREVSAQAFEDFPLATKNAVWEGPTNLLWSSASRFLSCKTEVHTLYEVSRENQFLKLMGEECRIHVDRRTQEYVEELTVCKKNAKFMYTNHCENCQTFLDVRRWATERFFPEHNYVVIGPIEFFFYGFYYASHSKTLVAFVVTDRVYFYTNARLIFYGNSGNIYKLDLSANELYNQGSNRGLFEPNQPPGYPSGLPYFTPADIFI